MANSSAKDDSRSSKPLTAREELKQLEAQRTKIESQIRSLLNSIPEEFRNVSKPAVYKDSEGYPRSDVDIWTINGVRKEVIVLQNDHKTLMKQIETKLFEVFQNRKPTTDTNATSTSTMSLTPTVSTNTSSSSNSNSSSTSTIDPTTITTAILTQDKEIPRTNATSVDIGTNTTPKTVENGDKENVAVTMATQTMEQDHEKSNETEELAKESEVRRVDARGLKPILVVKLLIQGSPANESGLKIGDVVLQFGTITYQNYSPELLQSIVTSSIHKEIPVLVRRNSDQVLELGLIPKKWNGLGLLGYVIFFF
ncbi:hypothetical protein RFI_02594 [Reticulomyxa filosa]|uniref:Nas2 N-terminal domain-containing protein n=1 Tax=Reticulomyxa filosa TaxID=46433 RepID=X6P8W4_RETFI|nr:hypothetical protein RFI_02594 [Reticulomyxa filosa]|eukprot:ETO34499.1 hypothetical protein RFI_02594 [Reticulomyxa filosa]